VTPASQLVSIDMSRRSSRLRRAPATPHHLRQVHVVWHASTAVDKMRRIEQRSDAPSRACAGRCSRMVPAVGRGRGRPWRPDRPDDQGSTPRLVYKEHCARSSNQADQRRARHAPALVHLCHALQGRADEGGRDSCAVTWKHRGLGADATDQRLLEALNGLFQPPSARPRVTRMSTIRTVIF